MSFTWNPSDKSSQITLSNGNLTMLNTGSGWYAARSTGVFYNGGKWYYEVTINTIGGGGSIMIGIGTSAASLSYPGADSYGYGYFNTGVTYYANGSTSYGDSYTTNDVIGVAFDADNGKIWWSKNGTWQASGNPAAGTNEAYSSITGLFYAMVGLYNTNDQITAAFSKSDLTYSPPAGFSSIEITPVDLVPGEWANRIKLIVRNDIIDSDLTNFPVLINLSSDSGLNNADVTDVFDKISTANRKKIAITGPDGTTQQYVEIENWDSTLERATLWTKCPSIYASSRNILYLYYDPTISGNTTYVGDLGELPAPKVWEDSYKSVIHLSDNLIDSTGNLNDGTNNGTDLSYFKIGKGRTFVETNTDDISINNYDLPSGSDPYTYEFIFKTNDYNDGGMVVSKGNESTLQGRHFTINSSGLVRLTHWTEDNDTNYTISAGTIYHFHVTYNGSTIEKLFVNGREQDSITLGSSLSVGDTTIALGKHHNFASNYIDMQLDEYRESDVVLTDDWIRADHYSQFDNMIYFETTPSGATWLENWDKRIKITIDHTKIDEDLFDYPLMINLASGTGMTNTDVTDVFDELTTTSSGITDSYTKLLLHMEGNVAGTNHDLAAYGNPYIAYEAPTGFDYSLYFDGSGDYFYINTSADFNIGTGDFTVECWAKPTVSQTANAILMKNWTDSWASGFWSFHNYHATNANKFSFWVYNYSSPSAMLTSTSISNDNVWHHVAVTRTGNTWRLFVDGVKEDEVTSSVSLDNGVNRPIYISSSAADQCFSGYGSEYRISNGISRWTSNFTPPSSLYTTSSGIDSYTKLLVHPEGDLSANKHSVVLNGAVELSNSQNRLGLGGYYFNGTSSFVSLSDHDDWNFGTDDFTIDLWFYATAAGPNYPSLVTTQGGWYSGSLGLRYHHAGYDEKVTVHWYPSDPLLSSNNTFALNMWHHVALVRNGTTTLLFVNGKLEDKATISASKTLDLALGGSVRIGGGQWDGANGYYNGYMDELRLSKGVARWLKNFNLPVREYPIVEVSSWEDKKIAITESDGEHQQYVEIEDWNPYKRESYLWTKVPFVSSSEDTILYLYYDKDRPDNLIYIGDTGDEAAKNVWDENFKAVWHFSDTDLSIQLADSTGNLKHGTPAGIDAGDSIISPIALASNFDGGEWYSMPTSAIVTGDNDRTIEFLMYYESPGGGEEYLFYMGDPTTRAAFGVIGRTDGNIRFMTGSDDEDYLYTPYLNDWQYIQYDYDGSTARGYINLSNVTTNVAALNTSTTYFKIGAATTGILTYDGGIDEFRISNIRRSSAYKKANYYGYFDNLLTFESPTSRPTFVFTGYVKVHGVPAQRTVLLYRRSTGELVGITTSDSSTGYFEIPGAYSDYHFVVILPLLTEDFNLLGKDRLHPSV